MTKGKSEESGESLLCPVGRFFADLEERSGKKSKFFEHLTRSRVEFFKAVRSVVDEKIEALEKKGAAGGKKRVTKIKVE